MTSLTIFLWGLALGMVLWGSGADVALMYWLMEHYHQGANDAMRVLGEVGKGTFQAGVCALVGVGLWGVGRGHVARVWLWCVPVFLAAGCVSFALKVGVGRLRPKEVLWNGGDAYSWNPWVMDAGAWSFPSGHAVSTFAIATVLMMAFPRWKWVLGSVAVVLAGSRFLAVTPHYMGDVVAGAGVGVAVALVCVRGLQRRAWL